MTASTMRPGTGTRGRPAVSDHDRWPLVFPAILLAVVGMFNLLDGITAITRAHIFAGNATYVVGDLNTWGWVITVLGGLQVLASGGVVAGNQAARWLAVGLVSLNAVGQMFFVPSYPFWSLMIIAVDIVAIYALCAYGGRERV